jgi:hypothetical protein
MHRFVFKGLTREICRRAERDRHRAQPFESSTSTRYDSNGHT